MKLLRLGDRGAEVRQLQQLLTWWGIPTKVDGIFGVQTQESVKQFQLRRANRVTYASKPLVVDGIVGRETWAELTRTPVAELDRSTSQSNNSQIHPQMQAFLKLIRKAEGTAGTDGYNTIFTHKKFYSFHDHPRDLQCSGGLCSDAAGAYQFLSTTWDEIAPAIGATDFSPHWQDLGAIELIRRQGAYDDVINGRIEEAVRKCSWIWASLPPSRYNQPTISMSEAIELFLQYGGVRA
jgi:muramidase (phage lysozyme)